MAKKVSVINFKGGVGKTTLAFHLAAHLAQTNTVLVVDVDHQSSLSIVMLGGKLWERAASIAGASAGLHYPGGFPGGWFGPGRQLEPGLHAYPDLLLQQPVPEHSGSKREFGLGGGVS